MPLIKSKSPKAFEKNLKTEMHAGKPQKQALAIAYSVKRRAKKASGGTVESGSPDMNMAEGGAISASNEKRPMPDNRYNDSAEARRNSGDKAPAHGDRVLEDISSQASKGSSRSPLKIKHPKMVPSSVINARLRDEEDDLQSSAAPASPDEQPSHSMDEEGADRQGPKVPDMQDEHSTHRKPYAKGGQIEASDEHHHMDGRYEDDLTDLHPSMDEGSGMAHSHNEMGSDRQGPAHHEEEPHSEHDRMFSDNEEQARKSRAYAEGGSVHHEMDEQPEDEAELEHAASMAAAIMAKMKKFARGGEILEDSPDIHSHGSMDTHEDADQVDLSRNADEDANEEDQSSFNALRKENYSESDGLRKMDSPEDSNEHSPEHEDMDVNDDSIVSQIRRKMRVKSAISR